MSSCREYCPRIVYSWIEMFQEEKKPSGGGSALNDLVDLNFGGPVMNNSLAQSPNPPQRTAASLDPWSPMGEKPAAGGQQPQADPWGGMGPIISSSTIPDPWGGIGGVGVPPSRGSPLVFGSSSPPSAGAKPAAADPWGAAGNNSNGNNDPWGAPQQTEVSPAAKRKLSDVYKQRFLLKMTSFRRSIFSKCRR